MFGVSFLEIAVIGLVALVIVGPQKLPGMMRTAGEWIGKLRRMTSDVRAQTGIDDILREEGIDGVSELRSLLRGQYNLRSAVTSRSSHWAQPSAPVPSDPLLEFPVEGADCSSALPDDLAESAPPAPLPSEAPAEAEAQLNDDARAAPSPDQVHAARDLSDDEARTTPLP